MLSQSYPLEKSFTNFLSGRVVDARASHNMTLWTTYIHMSVVKMFVQALRKFPLTMFLRLTHGKHSVNYYVVVVV